MDEILDVARINSGRISLTCSAVDLAGVAAECVETVRPRCEDGGVDLRAYGLSESTWVLGDRARLIQISTNLLDNACKHTPAGGRISVALERHGESCDLKVADTGVGMEPATLDHLFEAFFQKEAGENDPASGLGLGLHLVKRLVGMHGGTVRAHSEGLGRGAEFIIQLPTITAPSPEVRESERVIDQTPQGVKVLIIDDNIDAALSMKTLLDGLGQRAEVAGSGKEGLERAQAFRQLAGFDDLLVKPASAEVVLRALGTVAA